MPNDRSPTEPLSQEAQAAAEAWLGADLARICVLVEDAPASWWENPAVYVPGSRLWDLLDDRMQAERRRRQMSDPA